jgi:hypothetical protein
MKRCPECRRDYFDDSLLYCLDDGSALLEGPAVTTALEDEASTVLLTPASADTEKPTRFLPNRVRDTLNHAPQSHFRKNLLFAIFFVLLLLGVGAVYFQTKPSRNVDTSTPVPVERGAVPKLYWQMTESEQLSFIKERAAAVQSLIGDEQTDFDGESLRTIKVEIDDYVDHRDSLSQKPFEEGLRVIYGRATQFAPVIARAYEAHRVPPALGIYQAMIESEYHDCPEHPHPKGPVGLFQFSRKTAAKYGLQSVDYCNVEKQADAAARHMSDLMSDFGSGGSNASLGLFSFAEGAESVREYLRKLRSNGITERSYWAILRNRKDVAPDKGLVSPNLPLSYRSMNYVPRFFAATIIGETPAEFDLSTPPLSSLVSRD